MRKKEQWMFKGAIVLAKTVGYPGNKSPLALYPKIIREFPPHKVYWELFAGSAQIAKRKKPAKLNIVCERDQLTYPRDLVVICGDALELLDELKFVGKDHLVYLDPPYIIKARKQQALMYKFELSDEQHRELIDKVLQCRCSVAISHYPCAEYDVLLQHGWRRIDMRVSYHGSLCTESLYMNFAPPDRLHETTYVGANKTDRQRIKRKASRWRRMLLDMPPQDRQAVLEALADLW